MDFDWDLSDKTDTETQTRHGESEERTGPADAIVQVTADGGELGGGTEGHMDGR